MKKLSFVFATLFGVSIMLTSCSDDDCCTCSGVEVCEDDYVSVGGISWEEWKDQQVGCDCD